MSNENKIVTVELKNGKRLTNLRVVEETWEGIVAEFESGGGSLKSVAGENFKGGMISDSGKSLASFFLPRGQIASVTPQSDDGSPGVPRKGTATPHPRDKPNKGPDAAARSKEKHTTATGAVTKGVEKPADRPNRKTPGDSADAPRVIAVINGQKFPRPGLETFFSETPTSTQCGCHPVAAVYCSCNKVTVCTCVPACRCAGHVSCSCVGTCSCNSHSSGYTRSGCRCAPVH